MSPRAWADRHEHHAQRALKLIVWSLVTAGVLVGLTHPIVSAYESNTCPTASWEAGKHIRNSIVYPETRPSCVDGTWTVTTPRKQMPEDAYGWNCFRDGNGTCGTKLEWLSASCLTDPKDGYTMCQNGSVYYREVSGAKLWPVERKPQ